MEELLGGKDNTDTGRTIRIRGRKEFGGKVRAEALVSPLPLEGFANCDAVNGYTTERGHPLFKVPFEGKVLVFPAPRGSGGFMSYGRTKRLPAAFLHTEGNTLSVACVMCARVPAMTDFEIDPLTVIETGDMVYVNADEGYIEVTKKAGAASQEK
jgi:predicted aconitase with swiveling domain